MAGKASNLVFPFGGLHRGTALQRQPPYTTPHAVNVRPFDVMEDRQRGGTRPGIVKTHQTHLGGQTRMVSHVRVIPAPIGGGWVSVWEDDFNYASFPDWWSQTPLFQPDGGGPYGSEWPHTFYTPLLETGTVVAKGGGDNYRGGIIRDWLDFDTVRPYSLELQVQPNMYEPEVGPERQATFIFRMDNAAPFPQLNSFCVSLLHYDPLETGPFGQVKLRTASYVDGVATTDIYHDLAELGLDWGLYRVIVTGDVFNVFWRGEEIYSGTIPGPAVGSRVGLAVSRPQHAEDEVRTIIDDFKIQYQTPPEQILEGGPRDLLVVSGGGDLFREDEAESLHKVETGGFMGLHVTADYRLDAVGLRQKLYIADWLPGPRFEGDAQIQVPGDPEGVFLTGFEGSPIDFTEGVPYATGDILVITNGAGMVVDGFYHLEGVTDDPTEGGTNTALKLNQEDVEAVEGGFGAGICTFEVFPLPKYYDPNVAEPDSLKIWEDPAGYMPLNSPIIELYNDRIVLAGSNQANHAWFMSRKGDPHDWNPFTGDTNPKRPFGSDNSDTGDIGEPITACIRFSDDYLIFGGIRSLWVLRGDPGWGGTLDNLSHTVGIMDRRAWCRGPESQLIFLSRDGLYQLMAGGNSYPIPLSHTNLPEDMVDIDRESTEALLEYDVRSRGVHVFLSPKTGAGSGQHFWYDMRTGTFWAVSVPEDQQPSAIGQREEGAGASTHTLLGSKDGYLRRFTRNATSDDGEAIEATVFYGPFKLGALLDHEGILETLIATVATGGCSVDWMLFVGDTADAALNEARNGTAVASGTWTSGLNYTDRPKRRGAFAVLKLSSDAVGSRWAMDAVTITRRPVGRMLLP